MLSEIRKSQKACEVINGIVFKHKSYVFVSRYKWLALLAVRAARLSVMLSGCMHKHEGHDSTNRRSIMFDRTEPTAMKEGGLWFGFWRGCCGTYPTNMIFKSEGVWTRGDYSDAA